VPAFHSVKVQYLSPKQNISQSQATGFDLQLVSSLCLYVRGNGA